MATAYTVLGVPSDAPQEQIAEAFRAKCAESHPDRAADEADRVARTARMAKLTLAKRYLGDPEARAKYDQKLADLRRAGEASPPQVNEHDADSIDTFLESMRSSKCGNIGIMMAELARSGGLVDDAGFARVKAVGEKGAEVGKGLADLVGLVRGFQR
jgi:DnaJ-class molecular chaperone